MAETEFGPFHLVRRIAVGGMAEVHLARTRGVAGFEKFVALKMIHPNFAEDQQFVSMLVDEAKIAVQLSHVNIAHTFDLGCVGETYYITMEYVDGADLFKILRSASEKEIDMPFDCAASIAKQVANGLDYAHKKRDVAGRPLGIVHRDVSPQNVLISTSGEVKLVDFGIAKAALKEQQTAAGVIKGKYYYMSPEQAWGENVDHRSDVFSTGIVLYEMLTGQMMYMEEQLHRLLEMVRKADIAPPSRLRANVPPDLERIVMRALRRRPEERYQEASQLAQELGQFLVGNNPSFSPSKLVTLLRATVDDIDDAAKRLALKPEAQVQERDELRDENSVLFRMSDIAPPPAASARPAPRASGARGGLLPAPPLVAPAKPPAKPAARSGRRADESTRELSAPASAERDPGQETSTIAPPLPLPSAPRGQGGSRNVSPSVRGVPAGRPQATRAAAATREALAPAMRGGASDASEPGWEIDTYAMPEGGHTRELDRDELGGLTRDVMGDDDEHGNERTQIVAPHFLQSPSDGLAHGTLDQGRASESALLGGDTPMDPPRYEPPRPPAVASRAAPAPPPPRLSPALETVPPLVRPGAPPLDANQTQGPTMMFAPGRAVESLRQSLPPPPMLPPMPPPQGGLRVTPSAQPQQVPGPGGPLASQLATQAWPADPSMSSTAGLAMRGPALPETIVAGGQHLPRAPMASLVPSATLPVTKLGQRNLVPLLAVGVATAVALLAGIVVLSGRQRTPVAVGSVRVDSVPVGAAVFVDGTQLSNVTPLAIDNLRVGTRHELRFELAKHQPYVTTVEIPTTGGEVPVTAILSPITGTLYLATVPAGAEVIIGGQFRIRTPGVLRDLDMEAVKELELRHKDFAPQRVVVPWGGKSELRLDIKLKR